MSAPSQPSSSSPRALLPEYFLSAREHEHSHVFFVPLGGLGEIGMNCFALVQDGSILVVDCGATFPDDDLGEDLILPDFSWLLEEQDKIVGIFITHAHEDHIGALPHLLSRLRRHPSVYAPPHASALIAERLKERQIDADCLCVVHPQQIYQLGPFEVEPIRVAHSIVDATALCISTAHGHILHTADFDLDAEQPAGWLSDKERFCELGERGIRLLLSDSTNIDTQERQFSEGDVARALGREIEGISGRVVVAMFASNAHRLQALGEIAQATGRRVCFLGRSLRRHYEVVSRLGHVKYPPDLLLAPEQVAGFAAREVMIVAGGSQGEAASTLRRLSAEDYPHFSLEQGDVVLFSSRIIPGNEKPVFSMCNDFVRQGVEVRTSKNCSDIHTSGHASRRELLTMMQWTRPQAFVPVHGTLHHLRAHRELAQEQKISETAVVENGCVLEILPDKGLQIAGSVPSGFTRIAMGGAVLSSRTRRRRFELARAGMVVVSVALSEQFEMVARPVVTALGVPSVDDDEDALQVLRSRAEQVVHATSSHRMSTMETNLKRAMKSAVLQMCGVRTRVVVHVQRVDSAATPEV